MVAIDLIRGIFLTKDSTCCRNGFTKHSSCLKNSLAGQLHRVSRISWLGCLSIYFYIDIYIYKTMLLLFLSNFLYLIMTWLKIISLPGLLVLERLPTHWRHFFITFSGLRFEKFEKNILYFKLSPVPLPYIRHCVSVLTQGALIRQRSRLFLWHFGAIGWKPIVNIIQF